MAVTNNLESLFFYLSDSSVPNSNIGAIREKFIWTQHPMLCNIKILLTGDTIAVRADGIPSPVLMTAASGRMRY